ncbi:MAG: hypothetical protein P1U40_04090 [Coxiellaceae bacterium]|nr:hypothetical protein [Coxiellaceae bacterium]
MNDEAFEALISEFNLINYDQFDEFNQAVNFDELSHDQLNRLLKACITDGRSYIVLLVQNNPQQLKIIFDKYYSSIAKFILLQTRCRDDATPTMYLAQFTPDYLAIYWGDLSMHQRVQLLSLKKNDGWAAITHVVCHQPEYLATCLHGLSTDQRIQLLSIKSNKGWMVLMLMAYHHPHHFIACLNGELIKERGRLLSLENADGLTALLVLARYHPADLVAVLSDFSLAQRFKLLNTRNSNNLSVVDELVAPEQSWPIILRVSAAANPLEKIRNILFAEPPEKIQDDLDILLRLYIKMQKSAFQNAVFSGNLRHKIDGASVLLQACGGETAADFVDISSEVMEKALLEKRWNRSASTLTMLFNIFKFKYPNCDIRYSWRVEQKLQDVLSVETVGVQMKRLPSVLPLPQAPPPNYDEVMGCTSQTAAQGDSLKVVIDPPPSYDQVMNDAGRTVVSSVSLTGVSELPNEQFMRNEGEPCFLQEEVLANKPAVEETKATISPYAAMTVFECLKLPRAPTAQLTDMNAELEKECVAIGVLFP